MRRRSAGSIWDRCGGRHLNGAALGFGGNFRIAFSLRYCLALGCFLLGNTPLGAAAYGLYGFTRSASAGAMLLSARVSGDFLRVTD